MKFFKDDKMCLEIAIEIEIYHKTKLNSCAKNKSGTKTCGPINPFQIFESNFVVKASSIDPFRY